MISKQKLLSESKNGDALGIVTVAGAIWLWLADITVNPVWSFDPLHYKKDPLTCSGVIGLKAYIIQESVTSVNERTLQVSRNYSTWLKIGHILLC